MAKGCALSTGYLPRGGLPRNSVDRITDRLDMISAVDRGRKASTQKKYKKILGLTILCFFFMLFRLRPTIYLHYFYVNMLRMYLHITAVIC